MPIPLWLRRAIRPLVPDHVMAAVRLRQHSRQVRNNVDVVLPGGLRARRWLLATPDTYRVRTSGTFVGPPNPHDVVMYPGGDVGIDRPIVVVDPERVAAGTALRSLLLPLSDPWLGAAVLAEVPTPGLTDRRRGEPSVAPSAIAMRREIWEEVAGAPPDHPLPALLDRIRQAGHPYALLPDGPPGRSIARHDEIDAPVVVVLALVPMHDIGGGSRGAQLAMEFARRGAHVAYVAAFGTAESMDPGIRHVDPRLELYRLDRFDPSLWASRVKHPSRLAIVEAPLKAHVAAATVLERHGHHIVYDLIDDWTDTALGGRWYEPEVEGHLVDLAETLLASSATLADRLRSRRDAGVTLVPNAVNTQVFGPTEGRRPHDLPAGHVLGYHGSLYGGWLDWDALRRVARSFPRSAVVLIGDPPARRVGLPENVHFLGLKPQIELPAYVSRFSVGLVPFELDEVTHAVSPLKAYEYLASGVPVAAPPLRSLDGLPGVHTDRDLVRAVRAALRARRPDPRQARAAHGWAKRVDAICDASSFDISSSGERRPVQVTIRPVVHHDRHDRLLS